MNVFYIALKDLLRSFRSAFLLVMMFVAPLLLTGLIYFAFGRAATGRFDLPVTRVQIANLDQADSHSGLAAGQMLAEYLQGEELSNLLQVTLAPDAAGARAAVDRGDADVALLIPPNLTQAALVPDATATVIIYHDPTLTLQPGLVQLIAGEFIDGFSGLKIVLEVTARGMAGNSLALDPATREQIQQRYIAWVQSAGHSQDGGAAGVLDVRTPVGDAPPPDLISMLLGAVMAGMMIFFVFFTGAAAASSLIHEEEEGTLSRLFTTPAPRAAILGGKFLAILLTLIVQVLVLLLVSRLLFAIHWGHVLAGALLIVGMVVAASGFGICLMSFIKTTRQSGPVLGLVMSVTGLLSGLIPTGNPAEPSIFDKVSLVLPQGWAMRGWKLALNGATLGEVIVPVTVMLLFGLVLFAFGVLSFRKRFA